MDEPMAKSGVDANMTGTKTSSEDSVPEFVFGTWIAYLSAVGNYGLAIGLPFAMSVLFVDWQGAFGATRAHTAAVYSTNVCILFGAAIIPAIFMHRFGARSTVLAGSCLACLGCVASSFATSMNLLIFSNGVLGGLGFCFIQLPSMTAVNMAFSHKYRSMAVSVCASSVAVCSMAFPYLYRYLVHHYSWRVTMTIIGGVALQTAVMGFLMTSHVRRPSPNEGSTENGISLISSEQTSNTHESKEEESKYSSYGGNMQSEKEIPIPLSTCQYKAKETTRCGCNHRLMILANRLRNSKWKFLIDFTYLLYVLYLCTCLASMYSFILMMMDFARTKGFYDNDAGTFFLFLIYATSLFGRLLVGFLNLIPFLHSITLLGMCGLLISCSFFVLGNVTDYSTIVGFLAMVGLGSGGILGIYTKAVLDIRGITLDIYPLALGLAGSVEGIFDFSTPVLIGYSVDATGSYTLILHFLGIIAMMVSIAMILSQVCSTCRTFKRTDTHSDGL